MVKFLISMMILSIFVSGQILAAPQNTGENLKLVKSYEEKAKALDKEISEHEKMRKDYEKELGPGMRRSQVFRAHKIEQMKTHCNAIIQKANELAAEYRKMAKLYSTTDKDLQKTVKK